MTEAPRPAATAGPYLLQPVGAPQAQRLALLAIALLALSAMLIVAGAAAMPPGYSWLTLSISESAAQGQLHGWIVRLSFLCYGAAVLLLSIALRDVWPRLAFWSAIVFAASMAGVAAFSHAPWQPGVPADAFEDLLHSIAASGMGTAFCVAVVARFLSRGPGAIPARALDIVALISATAVPALLASGFEYGGLLQRIMFAVGYIWYAREALLIATRHHRS